MTWLASLPWNEILQWIVLAVALIAALGAGPSPLWEGDVDSKLWDIEKRLDKLWAAAFPSTYDVIERFNKFYIRRRRPFESQPAFSDMTFFTEAEAQAWIDNPDALTRIQWSAAL